MEECAEEAEQHERNANQHRSSGCEVPREHTGNNRGSDDDALHDVPAKLTGLVRVLCPAVATFAYSNAASDLRENREKFN